MTFEEAFAPWLPTLQDMEVRKQDDDPQIAAYYSRFGWENLVVPADCPKVTGRMSDLKTLFDQRYAFRKINMETPERWQIRLQNNFDRVVHTYERAYTLYDKYANEMLDDMIGGEVITRDTTGTNSVVNTPDYATNVSDDYADNRSNSQIDETITSQRTGDDLIDNINKGFRSWVDIDQALIQEFENNFLNVFWY